ncbi:MAG: FHA domain-containing protein [Acidimicrobiales bacterium]
MHRKTAFFSTGSGLAASIGNASLFIASDIASSPARDLLSLFRQSAVAAPDSVGVVRALARVVAQHGFESVPPFACVIAGNSDAHAIVYGNLKATIRTTQSSETLDGAMAVTWVDRRFEGTLVDFAVGEPLDPASSWFFAEGIVPAAGMVVSTPVDNDRSFTPSAYESRFDDSRANREVIAASATASLIDLTEASLPEPVADQARPDLPPPPPPPYVEADAPSRPSVSADAPTGGGVALAETRAVAGMACTNGHLNRPDAALCELCYAELDRGRGTVIGARPSLGVLVFDDGARRVDLNRPVIVGVSPPSDVVIAGEDAETVIIDSDVDGVSDTQFEVHFESWDVFVIDRSTTGTFLDDAAGRRHRLPRHARVKLRPGSMIAFGEHTVRVDSAT